MTLLKLKRVAKKIYLYAKKFWWAVVLGLGLLIALLLSLLTRNGAFVASLINLLEAKRAAHDEEIETLARINDTEVSEKNKKLKEHQKRLAQLEEEYKARNETLDKEKRSALKQLVDESYNDPEKLSTAIAELFGLDHG